MAAGLLSLELLLEDEEPESLFDSDFVSLLPSDFESEEELDEAELDLRLSVT
ncbi:MAG TPA: hypothetical protein VK009_23685 [Chloroflexota bacterium]|nr:hypothetical protein [Chloroflexota bacterium]